MNTSRLQPTLSGIIIIIIIIIITHHHHYHSNYHDSKRIPSTDSITAMYSTVNEKLRKSLDLCLDEQYRRSSIHTEPVL